MQTNIHLVRFLICSITTNTSAPKSNLIDVHIGKTLQKCKKTTTYIWSSSQYMYVCSITINNIARPKIHPHRRGQRFGPIGEDR